jgi:YesN/AraC family two-component response regulator
MRILIVDDSEIVRRGIKTILSCEPTLQVCGESADGRDALEKARELLPDLVLLDINMPVLSGFAAARLIRGEFPNQALDDEPGRCLATPTKLPGGGGRRVSG